MVPPLRAWDIEGFGIHLRFSSVACPIGDTHDAFRLVPKDDSSKKLYELCIVVIVSCFQASFYGSGGCWGEGGLWGRGEQKWLFTLHSDQNFQGIPEPPDSKTGTRPVK